jgi:hypothetical protein
MLAAVASRKPGLGGAWGRRLATASSSREASRHALTRVPYLYFDNPRSLVALEGDTSTLRRLL